MGGGPESRYVSGVYGADGAVARQHPHPIGRIGMSSIPILPTVSQHKRMTYANCCIYRVIPPDDDQ